MNNHGTNETLGFNDFSGTYGYIPNGYGGFDWTSLHYFNNDTASAWQSEEGYQYPIAGRGEAVMGSSGEIVSANLSESFTLKSMLVDSGASFGVPVLFTSYTYHDGTFAKKASDWLYVTPSVQKIDFATLGGKGDFQNIAAVFMVVGSHTYGMNGGYYYVGGGMLFDNLKVHWNGKAPGGHGHALVPEAHHLIAAHAWSAQVMETASSSHQAATLPAHDGSMLASLDADLGHSRGGLTEQFALPHPEHFGP